MGSAPSSPVAWLCPTCGRHVPLRITSCRCGADRLKLEEMGFKVEAAQRPVQPAASRPEAQRSRWLAADPKRRRAAEILVGYRTDVDLPRVWRIVLATLLVAGSALVFVAVARTLHRDPLPIQRNVEIHARLEDVTRAAPPGTRNTIPAFLALPGVLGAMPLDADPDRMIGRVDLAALQEGLCTPTVAHLVRHEYPGHYARWSDERLEKQVLQKHPEYRDRVCAVSIRALAAPQDIVKYDLRPRSPVNKGARWLAAVLAAAAFAIGGVNLYYRVGLRLMA